MSKKTPTTLQIQGILDHQRHKVSDNIPMDTPTARAAGKIKIQRRDSLKIIRQQMENGNGPSQVDARNCIKLGENALSIVVIGASGDLAKKKTYPALMELYLSGFLPTHARIFGFARSALTDDMLHAKLKPFLLKKTPGATEVS